MTQLLELHGISKTYPRGSQRSAVLTDASFTVAQGEIAAIVGSRLEGKTTLLKVAAGLERPDEGRVLFRGINLASCTDAARARLFGQEIAWASSAGNTVSLDVLEYLTLPLLMARQRGHRKAKGLAMDALERVGAAECSTRRWSHLSRWERVLVTLARAVVTEPLLIVIDDLFDGFGMLRTQEAGDLLTSLIADVGCAVLLSTCDLEPATMADSVYSLEGGVVKPLADGTHSEAAVIDFPTRLREARVGGAGR
jgi:putative ABC transport system ATP-binding protein